MKTICPNCKMRIEINVGSLIAKKRWENEVPDTEKMSEIGKLGAKKRWENHEKKCRQ